MKLGKKNPPLNDKKDNRRLLTYQKKTEKNKKRGDLPSPFQKKRKGAMMEFDSENVQKARRRRKGSILPPLSCEKGEKKKRARTTLLSQ